MSKPAKSVALFCLALIKVDEMLQKYAAHRRLEVLQELYNAAYADDVNSLGWEPNPTLSELVFRIRTSLPLIDIGLGMERQVYNSLLNLEAI